jgi:nucleoside-diphosphate-sugar epimerase
MKRWLITGGAGFIGSHLAAHLRKRGEHVVVLDNFVTGTRDNLRYARPNRLVRGDIRNPAAARRALKGIDYVLHQAALRSVPRSLEDPSASNDVNVSGTLNLLLEAVRARVKRFVYASSSSVYGDGKTFPQKETQLPQPLSPYAVSKLAAEYYCGMFSKTYGLATVSLRYFNVFGPRQDPASKYAAVIPKFILAAINDEEVEIHGDGEQSRDFTYIDNVIQANVLAATRRVDAPKVYNVAVEETHSVLDILRGVEKSFGKKLRRRFAPSRRGDVRMTYGAIRAIRRDLGYRPHFDFQKGLQKTIDYFRGLR